MKQPLSILVSASCCTLTLAIASKTATAQITTDNTTNTKVDTNGKNFTINNGDRAGSNLFHSFQDFSVPNGGSAFFNNAEAIQNIFSRVTGGNISNIDGLIRANGSANLFLINPAGIIFGEGASLDIGGSFYGSTADSILFEDGKFSATDLDSSSLLTINAPIGLSFRDNPGEIINRSVAGDLVKVVDLIGSEVAIYEVPVGLEVKPGRNISLIGGEVKLENGNINAPGGTVELGGLKSAGTVSISDDGSIKFPTNIARSSVTLSNIRQQKNGSIVNVAGDGKGAIKVYAKNLEFSGRSLFLAGIKVNSQTSGGQAGDIDINVTDNIFLDSSRINNLMSPNAEGNSGDINIKTKKLFIDTSQAVIPQDLSSINASTLGRGNAGNIVISASDRITFDSGVDISNRIQAISLDSDVNLSGRIQTAVEKDAVGKAGDIEINTGSLLMNGRNAIRANTFGKGDAGNITINASEQIFLQGEFKDNARFTSLILSQQRPGAEGNSGDIIINTPFLSLSDHSIISTSSRSFEAGNITIQTDKLFLRNTSGITAGGKNGGGNLFIDARFIVAFPEQSSNIVNFPNNALLADATRGEGGNINISATGIFGIKKREREPGVNFISASSEFGLDGNVSINTPDVNALQAYTELPDNPIESEQTVAQACRSDRASENIASLRILGKGGIPPKPTLPLNSDAILVDGVVTTSNTQAQYPQIELIKTQYGDILPARGIIKTEDDRVLLTTYPTENLDTRTSKISANCTMADN